MTRTVTFMCHACRETVARPKRQGKPRLYCSNVCAAKGRHALEKLRALVEASIKETSR